MTGSARTETPDEALIAAATRGETRAFEKLLDRHESAVLRVLRLMGVPAQDREDVAQDVFVRVFRHLRSFQRGRSFGAWVYRIAVNAAHDYRARQGRRSSEASLELLDEYEFGRSISSSPTRHFFFSLLTSGRYGFFTE